MLVKDNSNVKIFLGGYSDKDSGNCGYCAVFRIDGLELILSNKLATKNLSIRETQLHAFLETLELYQKLFSAFKILSIITASPYLAKGIIHRIDPSAKNKTPDSGNFNRDSGRELEVWAKVINIISKEQIKLSVYQIKKDENEIIMYPRPLIIAHSKAKIVATINKTNPSEEFALNNGTITNQ